MAVGHISLVGSHSLWWSLSKVKVPQYFWKPQNNFTKTNVNAWKIRIRRVVLIPAIGRARREIIVSLVRGICVCVCVKTMYCFGDISPWRLFSDFQEAVLALSSGDSRTREIYLLSIQYFEEGTEA